MRLIRANLLDDALRTTRLAVVFLAVDFFGAAFLTPTFGNLIAEADDFFPPPKMLLITRLTMFPPLLVVVLRFAVVVLRLVVETFLAPVRQGAVANTLPARDAARLAGLRPVPFFFNVRPAVEQAGNTLMVFVRPPVFTDMLTAFGDAERLLRVVVDEVVIPAAGNKNPFEIIRLALALARRLTIIFFWAVVWRLSLRTTATFFDVRGIFLSF
jgi:hypothetical protein